MFSTRLIATDLAEHFQFFTSFFKQTWSPVPSSTATCSSIHVLESISDYSTCQVVNLCLINNIGGNLKE